MPQVGKLLSPQVAVVRGHAAPGVVVAAKEDEMFPALAKVLAVVSAAEQHNVSAATIVLANAVTGAGIGPGITASPLDVNKAAISASVQPLGSPLNVCHISRLPLPALSPACKLHRDKPLRSLDVSNNSAATQPS